MEWLDELARASLPAVVCALLLLAEGVPLGLPGSGGLGPELALGAAFYWSLARPQLMSGPVVFGLGLFADLLAGTQPGLHVLLFLLLHALARRAARSLAGRGFGWLWFGFAATAFVLAVTDWCLRSLFQLAFLPVLPGVVQLVLTVALFPAIAVAAIRIDRMAVAA